MYNYFIYSWLHWILMLCFALICVEKNIQHSKKDKDCAMGRQRGG